jgi:hypothetical protein
MQSDIQAVGIYIHLSARWTTLKRSRHASISQRGRCPVFDIRMCLDSNMSIQVDTHYIKESKSSNNSYITITSKQSRDRSKLICDQKGIWYSLRMRLHVSIAIPIARMPRISHFWKNALNSNPKRFLVKFVIHLIIEVLKSSEQSSQGTGQGPRAKHELL